MRASQPRDILAAETERRKEGVSLFFLDRCDLKVDIRE